MSTKRTTIFTFVYKIALSGTTFVTSALTARNLNYVDRVDFQYAGTISSTGMTYVGGLTSYYPYRLSKSPAETDAIVQMGNLFTFLLSLLIWLVAIVTKLFVFPHLRVTEGLELAWWATLCMPFAIIFGYGSRLLQGLNEISWLNRANMAQPILFLLLYVPIFVDKRIPEHTRLLLTYLDWIGTFGLAALATMYVAYRTIGRRSALKWKFHPEHWLGTVQYGGWLSVSQFVSYANYRMDFWVVGFLVHDARSVSLYGVAVAASEVLLNISNSIASVVFTRMTGGNRQDSIRLTELSSRHTLISSSLAAVAMYIVFPVLIPLAYTHRYAGAILPFVILLPGLIIKAASNIVIQYATNQLGDAKAPIWMNGISAIINAIACVIFIPFLQSTGGAIASTVSYVLSFAVYVWWFGRVNDVNPIDLIRIRRSDLAPYWGIAKSGFRALTARR